MRRASLSGHIKNSRSSGLSVRIAAFISALLLSLLCGLFYNAWKYEVERIELDEGGWHSRILAALSAEDIEAIKDFPSVKDAAISENGTESAADIYFRDRRDVFSDTPRIAERLGIPQEKIAYHYDLLALYLLRDSGDTAPRLLFPLFLLIALAASFSLIVVIHNAFAVSMSARIRQLGILSSVGATPKQLRAFLLREAFALCAGPILAGDLLGIAGSAGLLHLSNVLPGGDIAGRHSAAFGYHPLVLAATLLVTAVTVWISAWLPARRLSRLTPLEAIKNAGELQLTRKKSSRILSLLFGVEGELAGNALKAQRKALRTASLSLLLAFLAFALMQCVFTLSQISTNETYFARYQDVWDIMATIKDTDIGDFEETAAVQALDGVESAVVYQKAAAKRIIAEDEMSEDMKSFGGFSHASAGDVTPVDGGFLVSAPIVILDDGSFAAYCERLGIAPRLDGAVVLNQIRDVTNPDFRHPVYMPYLNGESEASVLRRSDGEETAAEIPVLAYTQEASALREEYAKVDYYELVHFIPASLWREIKGRIGGAQADSFVCVRAREGATLEDLNALMGEISRLTAGKYAAQQENRIQEYETNRLQIRGMLAIFGGFCALLALIGIGNVFSNALGFVRQRRREFARYMSVGMTPRALQKMFCIEALVIAGRPVLISLPLLTAVVGFLLHASYMEAGAFFAEAPFVPIFLFMLAIFGAVALAYSLAWRSVRGIRIAEVLRDDTMM